MTELWDADLTADAKRVGEAVAVAGAGMVDREVPAEVVALCAVAGEHLLVVGPPGTAKSEVVRRVAGQLGGRYFEYLLGRFTEPNELFGSVDLARLREGRVEYETGGMLPEAEIAFLDEVFLGSTAVLNTLLGLLNERVFRRGATVLASPLRICVGAANSLPEDPALAAFADRFLARLFVSPVPDDRLEELLEAGRRPAPVPPGGPGLVPVLDRLAAAARHCALDPVTPVLATAVRRLRAAGVPISDRRAVRSQRLVAAAATLDGRTAASERDLWVLPLIAPTPDAQALARNTLTDLVGAAANHGLAYAAEELSRGPLARAGRLARVGTALLAETESAAAAPAGAPVGGDLRLRLEATLREIDASFTAADLPAELAAVRSRLVAAVRP
ncbi:MULTISPECIES: AAA family ATPase [Kitasatospora]|uniref:Putative ATPase n=1 Tax=Kitasatospora setae (strain ATCC 33774 / DSM 43861 / JCM 3304 / KCC A-0304 / NBRC 14216 / KM-6054) TaxID=452652 RepID=E4NIT5_KITSK|nr:AAA family ATPase [Kitasatospora setae]BAJ32883.1 putative ATPase [Kitasatospora setae KM-6054]